MIKRIEICGFRGIPTRLEIPFVNGKAAKSLVLYGRNGTGKSSLTDAWEWFTSGKIVHLAREGAEESAYPHMTAKPGSTYVEVEFVKLEMGVVRLTFDPKRMRAPRVTGNLEAVRKLVAHPCHVRHADLTRFVLLFLTSPPGPCATKPEIVRLANESSRHLRHKSKCCAFTASPHPGNCRSLCRWGRRQRGRR